MKRFFAWFSIQAIGALLFLSGVAVALIGFLNKHDNLSLSVPLQNFIADFYTNIATELTGLAFTILVIDQLYERSKVRQAREQLMRQMGGADNGLALNAVIELRALGCLRDGSLHKAHFYQANLQEATLFEADLEAVDFSRANLRGVDLKWANLHGANLHAALVEDGVFIGTDLSDACLKQANLGGTYLIDTNLQNADLRDATLSCACLWESNLRGALVSDEQLRQALMLHGTIMPDCSLYDGKFNLKGDLTLAGSAMAVDDMLGAQTDLPTDFRPNEEQLRLYLRWKWVSENLLN